MSPFDKTRLAHVRTASLSPYTLLGTVRKHAIVVDEPEDLGGGDFGPDPMEMVALSLAACTSLTLKMYAQRRKWDLTDLSVSVTHDSFKQEDGQRGDHFRVTLTLPPEIEEAQRVKLDEIVQKCPVHKMLHGSCVIEREWRHTAGATA
ncbi:OsmC family protein [bacterium SGD-2]|nr:OsmC family protein [bacterium SGD-2]